ncbi:fructosamine kinase family protein [Planctomonas psychrotolerans]|uniref:fructosamine kinase family protein n=1 Tax=Planctomonas psychrotolerans TaxID=2528712 RepID=UPI0012395FBC|nr:fructosamine kinase family protein [Planctomonas psychrotolerans]
MVSAGSTIVKTREGAPEGFFEAEAAGLAWLDAAGGTAVVPVVSVASGRIELERVMETRPTRHAATAFGASLARTHAAGAAAFGAPPDGWAGPCFIGRRPQRCEPTESWGAFYAQHRVLPFLAIAREVGNVDAGEAGLVERACDRLLAGDFDDDSAPARLHGDLWSGNVLWGTGGVVLIDPAAHGGHPETDLAMLALFGAPHLDAVLGAYDAAAPLASGWEERVPLHQLHPLAVHAAGHGRSYGRALAAAAEATLALPARSRP